MGMKITVHKTNPLNGITTTIAVDQIELQAYLDLGYVLGPGAGDKELPVDATRKFVADYVPEGLRSIGDGDHQNIETVIAKVVALFEDTLSGQYLEEDFLEKVDTLYEYWDVIGHPYKNKVKVLLDPYGLSDYIAKPEQLGQFLYFLSSTYSTKGTMRAFKWALSLLGVEAQVIAWYDPNYLIYRPSGESCRTLVKLIIGDKPIYEEIFQIVQQLIDLLLDICNTVVSWLYTKLLTEQVDITDAVEEFKLKLTHVDCYNPCVLEIYHRGLEGEYGVHVGSRSVLMYRFIGSSWEPIVRIPSILDHDPLTGLIIDVHNGIEIHGAPYIVQDYCGPEAGLLHTLDPYIRHCKPDLPDGHEDLIFHNEDPTLTHNEQKGFNVEWFSKYKYHFSFERSDWGIFPYPKHLGEKELTNFWTSTPARFAFCNRDPRVMDVTHCKEDQIELGIVHTFSRSVHNDPNVTHSTAGNKVIYDDTVSKIKDYYIETIELVELVTQNVVEASVDLVPIQNRHNRGILHNTGRTHSFFEDVIDANFITVLEDQLHVLSEITVRHDGKCYHDKINRVNPALVEIEGSFYLKAPDIDGSDAVLPNVYSDELRSNLSDETMSLLTRTAGGAIILTLDPLTYLGGKRVPDRMYFDGTYNHDDGNDHSGFALATFLGTNNWRLTHGGDTYINVKSITDNGTVYSPGQDPLIWTLPAFM